AIRKHFGDVRLPRAGAHEALEKAIGLAELEADAVRGFEQPRGRAFGAPQIPDALVFRREIAVARGSDAPECSDVTIASLLDEILPLARRGVRAELHRLVDDREVAVVMEEARVRVHLGVHANPELDVPIEA